MERSLDARVRQRAGNTCEYCRLPQFASVRTFEVDHILAQQHGGLTVIDNLALACPRCNKRKGPNLSGFDAVTAAVLPLFHPRRHRWPEHFRFSGLVIEALTPTGRATINALDLNGELRLAVRARLLAEGVTLPLPNSGSP